MKNRFIRMFLIWFLNRFISCNCQYNSIENETVENCLKVIQPVNKEYEKFNLRNPNHGKAV